MEGLLIIRDNREEGLQVLLNGADITEQVLSLQLDIDAPLGKSVTLVLKPQFVQVKVKAEVFTEEAPRKRGKNAVD